MPAEGKQGRRRRLSEAVWASALAAILAVVAGVVLEVVPRSHSESCAEEGASLGNVLLQPGISLRDFLDETNASTEGYTARQLDSRVNGVFSDLRVAGYRKQHLTLKWSLVDAATNAPVSEPSLRNRPALDVEPTACVTRLRAAIWTPVVRSARALKVAMSIEDDQGNVLASARTTPLPTR